jgi:hypothetical protein
VDAGAGRHYVTPAIGNNLSNEHRLRLLLHLLALIAGFNGLIAGPAAARASEPAVIAWPLSGGVEQASESIPVRHVAEAAARSVGTEPPVETARKVLAPQLHPVDERRIE